VDKDRMKEMYEKDIIILEEKRKKEIENNIE